MEHQNNNTTTIPTTSPTENRITWSCRAKVYGIPLLIFSLGCLILYARNMDPFLNPIVYTEDGVWVALGLNQGWVYALLNAKPTYFVFINIFLLYLSSTISLVVSGNPLFLLPEGIAIMSGFFYSAATTLVFITARKMISERLSYLAYFLILLMPLGISMNIIIGRLSQIGFFIPLVVVCLLFWRDVIIHKRGRYAVDMLVVLCAGTNPVVFAICGAWFALKLWDLRRIGTLLASTWSLSIPLAILALCLIPKMGADYGMARQFNGDNLIESLIGRPIAYPFLFPWYSKLSNTLCIIFLAAYIQFVRTAHKKSDRPSRQFIQLLSSSLFIYTIATNVMRPGLTGLLSGYQILTADQYFYGVNAMAILLATISAGQYLKSGHMKTVAKSAIFAILLIYAIGYFSIFEGAKPVLSVRPDLSFREQICASEPVGDGTTWAIKIYFPHPTLIMVVPRRYIDKSNCVAHQLDGFVALYTNPLKTPTFSGDEINITCLSSMDEVGNPPAPQSSSFDTRQVLNVRGWLALSTDIPRLFDQTYLTLTDAQGQRVFVSTTSEKRRDVAQAYQHRELAAAGFKSSVGLTNLKGSYKLGLAGLSQSRLYVCNQFSIALTIP
jgi:hypothetical protein